MTKGVLKILMLEDEPDDVGLINRALQRGNISFEARVVDCKTNFLQEIMRFPPDVILADHSLPETNSIEALIMCQAVGLNVPFFLVTGTVPDLFAKEFLKTGAAGYVLKSNLDELPPLILQALKDTEIGS